MFRLGVKTHFDAAHLLRSYQGKCSNLHGHRWEVEAVFSGMQTDDVGILADFSVVKDLLGKITGEYDHKNIAEICPFDRINPTAENIAREIFGKLQKKSPQGVKLEEVRVWESPGCWASFRGSVEESPA